MLPRIFFVKQFFSDAVITFLIPEQAAYTNDEVKKLVSDSTKQLKNHLMKTVYINKLQPEYKEYVLSKDPATLQDANNLAVALWRRKNPEDIPLKPKSIFSVEAELGFKLCLRDILGLT